MDEPATYPLLRACRADAIHLELRDSYTPNDPIWTDWRDGRQVDPVRRYRSWFELVSAATARGVRVRRARIVSEPVTAYVRFEHAITAALNLGAGEQVRWLSRRDAWDLLVPGCDLWVFDRDVVICNVFDGEGNWVDEDRHDDPVAATTIADAFEAIWERAIDHKAYRLD
jgi:uncharacterized protein DUF6879